MIDAVRGTLDETPPGLIADLMESGIAMAGGGSQLQGLVERISEETKMRAWLAEDSMTCVARGAGMVLDDLDSLRKVLVSSVPTGVSAGKLKVRTNVAERLELSGPTSHCVPPLKAALDRPLESST